MSLNLGKTMLRRKQKQPAQALVELALAITFLFMLVSAAVDLGLIFFTLQGLRTSAQEGAAFGSYPVQVMNSNGSLNRVDLNYNEIVNRVRGSTGDATGFADLRDLDGVGGLDATQGGVHANPRDPSAWIYVQLLGGYDPKALTGTCATNVPNEGMQKGGDGCWIKVTVRYNYRFIFPLAPVFGNTVQLQASQIQPVRSSYYITR